MYFFLVIFSEFHFIPFSKHNIIIRNRNKPSRFIIIQKSQITLRSINHSFLLFQSSFLLFRLVIFFFLLFLFLNIGQRTRVILFLNFLHFEIPQPQQINLLAISVIPTSHIPIKRNFAFLLALFIFIFEVFPPIRHNKRMGFPPFHRFYFYYAYESG